MGRDVIKVYARLKPELNRDNLTKYRILRRPKDRNDEDFLVLLAPFKDDEYNIDHRPESWKFSFHRIIEEEANQRDVFEDVGRPVIESVLDGYNGTVFAYGQTGSGKTYTIRGDVTTGDNRGIVPRTLSYLFDFIKTHPENVYSVEVAYLEIYNEYGYDLLDRNQQQQQQQVQQAMRLEDLPRLSIQEDEKGKLHLKNLTFHNVKSEDRAMELFLIADTPTNQQSSRSHCIFTIVLSTKQLGGNRYKRAKMHLVDLAGSERVYKCDAIGGTVLSEAKHINLSLHYLEQVIVCLNQENSGHIPYRNCLLTAILRDSLGGNCVTRMLATLSVSSVNLQETISTCRFAQRVALVRNYAKLSLERDLNGENTLLKLENEKLRKEIGELMRRNECLKKNALSSQENRDDFERKLDYYKNLVLQRDQEISALLGLLRKARDEKKSHGGSNDNVERRSKSKGRVKESTAGRLSETSELREIIEKSDRERDVRSMGTDFDGSCETKMNSLGKSSEGKSRIVGNAENVNYARKIENEGDSLKGSLGAIKRAEINDPSKNNGSILEEESERRNKDFLHDDSSIYSPDLSSTNLNRTTINNKLPDLMINDAGLVDCPVVENDDRSVTRDSKNTVNCGNVDNDFVKDLPLTGDPEIDEEIIAFYRAKRSGGIY